MKLFKVTFPEIMIVEEDKGSLLNYLNKELEYAEFEKDITDYSIQHVTNRQQIPENWSDGAIPWGVGSTNNQATVEEWIKLQEVFNQLDDEGTRILTELLKYGTTG